VTDVPSISRTRRIVGTLLLVAYAATVVVSGFAWPLGRGDLSAWPFNRSWWMFHHESGNFYHLRFYAVTPDGRRNEVSLDDHFRWPASQSTRRYDEIARDPASLRSLVLWACQNHNRTAAPNDRWRTLLVIDAVWRQTPGVRRPYRDVPDAERRETVLLNDEPCPGEAP
jgi:hypothetical protein